jgi:drug/metabolite transporter (DMT)-like permease
LRSVIIDSLESTSAEITPDQNLGPYAALIGVQVFFGSLAVIGKVVLAVVPPMAVVGFRVGITALLLSAVQLVRRRFWLQCRSDYVKLAGMSVVAVIANQILFVTGLSLTKASNASLLAVTIPIFTLAAGSILGKEKLVGRKVAGILLAAFGVVLILDPRNASFSSGTTLGDVMIVLNSLSYGIYVAISKDIVTRNGAFRSIMWIFVFASIVCVPLGAYSLGNAGIDTITPGIWLLILYVGVVATAAPYFLNAWALARVNPSTVAVFVYLQPLIGFVLAVIFLGEAIDSRFAVAALLIFAGVFLVIRKYVRYET